MQKMLWSPLQPDRRKLKLPFLSNEINTAAHYNIASNDLDEPVTKSTIYPNNINTDNKIENPKVWDVKEFKELIHFLDKVSEILLGVVATSCPGRGICHFLVSYTATV